LAFLTIIQLFYPDAQSIEYINDRNTVKQCDLKKNSQVPKIGFVAIPSENTTVIEKKIERPSYDVVRQR
jgi:hypothetical protein